MGRRLLILILLMSVVFVVPAAGGAAGADRGYDALIRRDSVGVPHVLADDYGSLGFGIGYAFAEDNICTAADFYVTVNGERSRWFGPDEGWTFWGNGATQKNRESDFFYRAINESGVIEHMLTMEPPHGPLPALHAAVEGYVAGYNHYLARIGGPDGVSDPRCVGQPWVRPIRPIDAYRRFYQLASLASTGVAIDFIGGAQPPSADNLLGLAGLAAFAGLPANATQADVTAAQAELAGELAPGFDGLLGIGSNAYGLGGEATANGKGMVLGNPHFPWQGGERLYQLHLTIPGVVDAAGAGLYGVPLALIGHTEGVAWSHTVSTAFRFTPFELTLLPGSPTTYLVDGQPTEMEARDVAIEILQPDGSVTTEQRTLYTTAYGPVMTGLLGLPLFPWTPVKAWALGDANAHMRYVNHFFEKNHASSVRELFEIQTRNQGVPWVNTIAADASGEAYYADISVVPNVPDAKAQVCNTALGIATTELLGLPVLDGSRSDCGWDSDPDAVVDGIFGPGNLPHFFRNDYVTNSNDSYWLSNPEEPLTGFARIIGDEETPRTLRTRLGLVMVAERLAGDDGLDGNRFTQEQLRDIVFNNRHHAAELVRDDVVAMCESLPGGFALGEAGPVDVSDACPVLAAWDLRDDLDSSGGPLFRRFWSNLVGFDPSGGLVSLPVSGLSVPWTTQFDPDDAVHTPNTLNPLDPRVQAALAGAVSDLQGAGIPLDGRFRDWQYKVKAGERIPIHGGPGGSGVFNAISAAWDGDPSDGASGWPNVHHGSSFVMVASFVDGPCPVDANAIVTYSQSEDETRPFFADQTRMYSEKVWNDMPFCEDELLADPGLVVYRVSQAASGPPDDAGGSPLPTTGAGLGMAALVLALAGSGVRRRSRP